VSARATTKAAARDVDKRAAGAGDDDRRRRGPT
jgi:hypothetical protein